MLTLSCESLEELFAKTIRRTVAQRPSHPHTPIHLRRPRERVSQIILRLATLLICNRSSTTNIDFKSMPGFAIFEFIQTIFSSAPQFLSACAIILLAQAIYVMSGFGAGLIALGCLTLVSLDVRDVVVTVLLLNVPGAAFVVAFSWRQISWREVLRICIGVTLGTTLGTYLLATSSPELVTRVLAALMVLTGLCFIGMPPTTNKFRFPTWTQVPVGVGAGLLSGFLGGGGPPLIIYYRLSGVSKVVFRGNLMAIFLATTLIRVAASAAEGLLTATRVTSAGVMMPAALLGMWLGKGLHARVSEPVFRKTVSIALAVLGTLLLLR